MLLYIIVQTLKLVETLHAFQVNDSLVYGWMEPLPPSDINLTSVPLGAVAL